MAIIQSGATADQLTIDPTSKASRITEYSTDGQPLRYPSASDRGVASISVRQTGTGAAPLVVWAMRNNSAHTLYIPHIWFQLGFNGTGAATEMQYEFMKGTGCTAFAGAPTTVTPLIKRTVMGNPDPVIGVLDTGFTLTGVTLGARFYSAWWARLTHSATQSGGWSGQFDMEMERHPLELTLNEVLLIRTVQTAVIGDILEGAVEFYGG